MPCNDWPTSGVSYIENPLNEKMKKRLDLTTRLLCGLCTTLKKAGQDRNRYPESYIRDVPGLAEWWRQHQEEDRKEEQRRKAEAKRKEEYKQARIRELEKELRTLKGR